MNALADIVKTNELDPQDGQIIIDRFGSYEKIAQEWETKAKGIIVTSRDQTTEMAMAREARKKFSNMRIELEKARKAIGEPAFRKYKAVNAVAKYLQSLIQPIEDHLLEQEDFIKRDDARIKAEKKVEADRKAAAEALALAEAERKEQERIRKENEQLKKEVEEKEKQIQAEREEARKKAEAKEKEMQAERKKAEAERLKLEEKAKKEAEARKQVEEKLEAEKEAQRKTQLEAKRIEDALAEADRLAKEEALKAPDKEKYQTYVDELQRVSAPVVSDKSVQEDIENIVIYLASLSKQHEKT